MLGDWFGGGGVDVLMDGKGSVSKLCEYLQDYLFNSFFLIYFSDLYFFILLYLAWSIYAIAKYHACVMI
jgi:hypothetical protein